MLHDVHGNKSRGSFDTLYPARWQGNVTASTALPGRRTQISPNSSHQIITGSKIDFCNLRWDRKIAKSDYQLCHFCPFPWNNSDPTEQIFMEFDILSIFRKSVQKIQVSLKSDKNNGRALYDNHHHHQFHSPGWALASS
jgi:hypothetical protein